MSILQIIKEELLFEKKKKNKTKKDDCYYKVKSRYDVWPSAYASGALVKCRKVGAANWGNSTNESEVKIDARFVKNFLIDFGTLISLNLSQITKMGKDTQSTEELKTMMERIRKPIINGKTYFEIIGDINTIPNNPRLLSTILLQVKKFIEYIEPRIERFVKDGESANGINHKEGWLNRISKIKDDYRKIVNNSLKKNEEVFNIKDLISEKRKLTQKPSSETSLKDWFGRKGAKGSQGGWVDCNAPDGKGGYKSCGRKKGEERTKYPACRPTPGACKKHKSTKGKSWGKKSKKESISESLQYHIDRNIPLVENIYRWGSEGFFNLINETRELYKRGEIDLSLADRELIETNLGEKVMFEGKEVWLDIPMEDTEILSEEDRFKGKKSSSPTRDTSGGKAYKVYVPGCAKKTDTNPRGIKLVRFGSGGLKAKLNNKEAKKSYNARHGCSKGRHNDKCKAGYYSCRLPRYAKALGLSGGGTWW
jgi:hypothetical protein